MFTLPYLWACNSKLKLNYFYVFATIRTVSEAICFQAVRVSVHASVIVCTVC